MISLLRRIKLMKKYFPTRRRYITFFPTSQNKSSWEMHISTGSLGLLRHRKKFWKYKSLNSIFSFLIYTIRKEGTMTLGRGRNRRTHISPALFLRTAVRTFSTIKTQVIIYLGERKTFQKSYYLRWRERYLRKWGWPWRRRCYWRRRRESCPWVTKWRTWGEVEEVLLRVGLQALLGRLGNHLAGLRPENWAAPTSLKGSTGEQGWFELLHS